MRMLVEQDRLSARDGHVAVGWLIVEDLFTVVALVVLPALAAASAAPAAMAGALGAAVGKAAAFAALIWLLGTRLVASVMARIAQTRSTELFTLTVFVVALGVAILAAEVFNVSVALGAFFAGLAVGQSRFGPQAAADMAPFRDVFAALFFVSIGMLFNPRFVAAEPLLVLAALGVVLAVKPLAALAIRSRSCAIPGAPRSPSRSGWLRSASSLLSWRPSACRWASCPPKGSTPWWPRPSRRSR